MQKEHYLRAKEAFEKDYCRLISERSLYDATQVLSLQTSPTASLAMAPKQASPLPAPRLASPAKSKDQNVQLAETGAVKTAQKKSAKKDPDKNAPLNSYGGFTLQFPSARLALKNTDSSQDTGQDAAQAIQVCRWLILSLEKPGPKIIALTEAIQKRLFPQVSALELQQQSKKPLLPFTRLLLYGSLTLTEVKKTLLEESHSPALETVRFFSCPESIAYTEIPDLETIDNKEKLSVWNRLSEIAKADLDEL